ncbi:hypothetical protein AB1Y20_021495 [Prymnesium parvum]|uniref:UFSP1/2/DUB catalytic domain-containing protein n=1 Tax=Prymnesium parvum TaxID=97485 RepID=A0AB34JMF5_PRYPA
MPDCRNPFPPKEKVRMPCSRQQGDEESLALAQALQAEEDAAAARALRRPPHPSHRPPRQRETPWARAPRGGEAELSPPRRLTVHSDAAHAMRVARELLAPHAPTLCADEACMPRQLDNWSCGYANLGALLLSVARRGLHGVPADLRPAAVQALVEEAWRAGFSPRDRTALVGSRKWIGAPEWIIALWHLRLHALIIEVAGGGRGASGPGGAGRAVLAAVSTCLEQCTDLPILLQHHGHSRTVLGVLARPRRLVVRDPIDPPGELRCFSARELDGKPYQIVVIVNRTPANEEAPVGLSSEQVNDRKGEPRAAALWTATGWKYDSSCRMRFK